MSKIRFRSLPSTEFSIAVAQAGAKAELKTDRDLTTPPAPEPALEPELEPTPDLPPPDPGLKAQISANRLSGIAPAGVFFEIELEGFNEFDVPKQDTLIVWDFGDEGAKFADLSGRLDMLHKMDATQKRWNDANTAYGFFVSHVYRNPGPHSVQARVYYSLNASPVLSNVLTFEALDPNEEIPLARTIYVSPNAAHEADVPDGAIFLRTREAGPAINHINAPRRIRFREGETFLAPNKAGGGGVTYIDSWGPNGTHYKFDTTSGNGVSVQGNQQTDEFVLRNAHLKGGYSMVTWTGVGGGIGHWWDSAGAVTHDNVIVEGANGTGFNGDKGHFNNPDRASICYIDCKAYGNEAYGFFGSYNRIAILGSFVDYPPDSFGWRHDGTSSRGAGVRVENFRTGGYFCCVDVHNPYGVATHGFQPPYKLQGDARLDARMNLDRLISEGGNITNTGVGSTSAERQFGLIDKMIFIGTAATNLFAVLNNRGTTARNLAFYQPHVENQLKALSIKGVDNNYTAKIQMEGTSLNKAAWYNYHSITICRWDDVERHTDHKANYRVVENEANAEVSNVVIHVPWDLTPQVADVDTSLGADGIAKYNGSRHPDHNNGAPMPRFATPDRVTFSKDGFSVTNQYTICIVTPTGANLTADAGEKVAFDYIDGTMRGTTHGSAAPAKGAFKP